MNRERVWLVLLFLIGLAALMGRCADPVSSGILESAPHATFDFEGRHYLVSSAYQEGTWYESMDWCQSIGEGWRLPTLAEAIEMRNNYDGEDPMDVDVPLACQGYESTGVVELWTSSECDLGAHAIHKLTTTIIDRSGWAECENDGKDSHFCCMKKSGYGPIHACPIARCVKAAGGPSNPTPFPSPSPTPASLLPPSVRGMDYVRPVYPHLTTTLYAAVYPAWQPMTYTWAFGDGVVETGIQNGAALTDRSHAYEAVGTYTATLSVHNGGGSSVGSVAVVVDPCAGDLAPPWGYRNILDVMVFLQGWQKGDLSVDLNDDGWINYADMMAMVKAWGKKCPGLEGMP